MGARPRAVRASPRRDTYRHGPLGEAAGRARNEGPIILDFYSR